MKFKSADANKVLYLAEFPWLLISTQARLTIAEQYMIIQDTKNKSKPRPNDSQSTTIIVVPYLEVIQIDKSALTRKYFQFQWQKFWRRPVGMI